MQQDRARQGQVIIQTAIDNDVAQIKGITKEYAGQPKGSGGDAINKEHIGQLPAADVLEAVKENILNQKIDPYHLRSSR